MTDDKDTSNGARDVHSPAFSDASPLPVRGESTDVERPVCKCGAPAHATRTDICRKGHAIAGNQRARRNPLEAIEDDADSSEPVDSIGMCEDALKLLRHEYRRLRSHLRLVSLTTTARRAARKDLRALSSDILEQSRFLETVRPSAKRAASLGGVLGRLSDATLAAVLKDLGVEKLDQVVEYDGPLPLKIELTDRPATGPEAAVVDVPDPPHWAEAREARAPRDPALPPDTPERQARRRDIEAGFRRESLHVVKQPDPDITLPDGWSRADYEAHLWRTRGPAI